jgi:hypothetical protein
VQTILHRAITPQTLRHASASTRRSGINGRAAFHFTPATVGGREGPAGITVPPVHGSTPAAAPS